jgi:lipoyl(octanoyl) transferase
MKSAEHDRQSLDVHLFDDLVEYESCWKSMQAFTRKRDAQTDDQLWLLQHSPVFTTGIRNADQDVHKPGAIPVVATDRGGLVTYHGPGQLVIYTMLDLKRLGSGLKALVADLEQITIDLLARHDIAAARRDNAPGVYADGAKIASLGLRVQHGCTYHGLSLNVDMDLSPFQRIVPCGLAGIEMTDMRSQGAAINPDEIGLQFVELFAAMMRYNPTFHQQHD